jgi:hypothetical protein
MLLLLFAAGCVQADPCTLYPAAHGLVVLGVMPLLALKVNVINDPVRGPTVFAVGTLIVNAVLFVIVIVDHCSIDLHVGVIEEL